MTFDFKNASKADRQAVYDRISREMGDNQFFTKKELHHLPEILMPDEQVLAFTSGLMDGTTWLITLTDKRIIFLDKGMIFGLKQVEISLDKINAISGKTGIVFGSIGIEDGATNRVIKNVLKTTVVKFANKAREAIEARKNESSLPAAVVKGDDIITKLERLGELREKGILTQVEFEQQKAKLIG